MSCTILCRSLERKVSSSDALTAATTDGPQRVPTSRTLRTASNTTTSTRDLPTTLPV